LSHSVFLVFFFLPKEIKLNINDSKKWFLCAF
jgi:hypothetical protein